MIVSARELLAAFGLNEPVDARHARNYQASRVSQRVPFQILPGLAGQKRKKPDYASPAFLHRQISDER